MALVTWRQHERKRKFSSYANKFCTATDHTHQRADLAPAESPKQSSCVSDAGGLLPSHHSWAASRVGAGSYRERGSW